MKKLGPITDRKELWKRLDDDTKAVVKEVDQVFGLKGIAYYDGGALVGAFAASEPVEAEARLYDWDAVGVKPVAGPALPETLANSRGGRTRRRRSG